MWRAVIGYYVHHHGDGHRQRALAVAQQAQGRIVLIGTGLAGRTAAVPVLELPDDRPEAASRLPARFADDPLHYAPLRHEGVRRRMAAVADWIVRHEPALMVVDVSVEIALLARLCGIPTVYVRLAGVRNDAPHHQTFRSARSLLAPFDSALDDPFVPAWVRDKTLYVPGLTTARAVPNPDELSVLVVNGAGGGQLDGGVIAAAAAETPELTWRVIGPIEMPGRPPPNLTSCGWVDDADREIARAGIVVGSAGDGVVSAVLAAGRPYVCLPQSRPYDEQRNKAGGSPRGAPPWS